MAEIVCSRCRRVGDDETALVQGWEHDLATVEDALTKPEITWVCPNCLTGTEQRAIDDEVAEIGEFVDELERAEGGGSYNPDALPGDRDFRPGPDWPPSLEELALQQGKSLEVLTEEIKRQNETFGHGSGT